MNPTLDLPAYLPHPDLPLPTTATQHKRVPRPRNAFMIFRSAFCNQAKITPNVEHDHRHISRIIGHCWNKMSEDDKDVWRRKAEQEKLDHERKYPGYRFCPTARTKKPVKRNVKRNGVGDLARCERLADLLLAGKEGDELKEAMNQFPLKEQNHPSEEPPFRSPLLPPLPLEAGYSPSPELSPTPESFPTYHYNSFQPSMPVASVPNNLVFEAPEFPALAYTICQNQSSAYESMRGFDIPLDPIQNSSTYSSAYSPYSNSSVSFYDPFAFCDSYPDAVSQHPNPTTSIMSEPVPWNTAFPFSA